jgi:hypothetical protein
MVSYLSDNIAYQVNDSMRAGMETYFRLATKHGLVAGVKPLVFI